MLVKTDTVQGTGNFGNQSGAELVLHKFLAGPSSGSSTDYPTYRDITSNDLPGGSPTRLATAFLSPLGGQKNYGTTSVSTLNQNYGGTNWVAAGTVSVIVTPPTAVDPVSYTFATSATANTASVISPSTTTGTMSLGSLKALKFHLKLHQTANMAMYIGLTDPLSSSNIATAFKNNNTPNQNFVGFRFSTKAGDPAWMCITQTSSGSQTANTSGVGADLFSHEFEIQYDGTNAVFFVDGVQVGSQNGTIPAASVAMNPFAELDNVNVAVNNLVDYYSWRWINVC